jgi:hypothetical protein
MAPHSASSSPQAASLMRRRTSSTPAASPSRTRRRRHPQRTLCTYRGNGPVIPGFLWDERVTAQAQLASRGGGTDPNPHYQRKQAPSRQGPGLFPA